MDGASSSNGEIGFLTGLLIYQQGILLFLKKGYF
jgi:hypothetical protein